MKEKSNLADIMIGLIKNLKNKYNLQVQYLHYNNAGENVAFKEACKQKGLGVDFEYTAQVHHNRMASSTENLLSFSTRCASCLMGVNSMLTYITFYGPKLQTP